MATFYLTNAQYPDNPQLFVVDVKQIVKLRGESGTDFSASRRGEHYWEIVIYTSGVDFSGDRIKSKWLDVIGTSESINDLINEKIKEICGQIDWSTTTTLTGPELEAAEDTKPPVVFWQYPEDGQIDVPLDSRIIIRIKDELPSKGIDISTLTMRVDGFDIVPEVYGNKYDYTITYKPGFSRA